MQRIINVVSACTFVLALANTAVIVLALTRGPSIVKKQLSELKVELTQTILDQVPVPKIPEMPQLPTETGPAITSPF
tara:strand:+ start:290 stop:520 length:231 start_codon:yes stop_codon:yes gene_type:complete